MDSVRLHFISGCRAGAVGFCSINHNDHEATCNGNRIIHSVATVNQLEKKSSLHRKRRETAKGYRDRTEAGNKSTAHNKHVPNERTLQGLSRQLIKGKWCIPPYQSPIKLRGSPKKAGVGHATVYVRYGTTVMP